MENTKCASEYNELLDCLEKYDRNWGKCQDQLKLFRFCYYQKDDIIDTQKK
ncbi:conserved Plasmodium protein, unknown function [Plasmodium vinckei]|uniref:CHCH domain-containing protein n=7 Tax=Plasmodium (Vinckeia) TaxID=418101 RepID=A0A077TJ95_PLACU|nr:conserved protein, unknown function [Plasmodium chabaudi chabaudi]XP_037490506.1 conserved Plasmodium protein, unknown function [Plasmodium vinckei vinckei]CAD2093040.1 conserved Plasmodium protein, unknown function [Plasmodium vinckei lentum]CAD2093041.1 conserved Plasmodium protein, unknown function [Plasmodium vinckei brucechwatti]CAD2105929.1 conserved Plasmodium protein, unknown function [Plasmodium vinckei petteri]CAD2106053.1 conserved Plasmodium protein, unknown function [Plasmodium|eukprot:XP_016653718.1 conserved Plasmodium protein, unknown function [Plasmodium chabaudi chabaudi]